MPETPAGTISSNQLRALAERADSYRKGIVHLVENAPGSPERYDIVDPSATADSRPVVMFLSTQDAAPPFKERQPKLLLKSEPQLRLRKFPKKGLEACDAVFTSLVAVEKFLVPYYARFSSPTDLKLMRDGFADDATALAVAHIPDSIESIAEAAADGDTDTDKNDSRNLYVLQPVPGFLDVVAPTTLDAFLAARRLK